jgi:hypothetical protein
MSADRNWNPERSLLQRLGAFEEGKPPHVSEAELWERLERIIKETLAAKGWNQNQRVEASKIADALDAMDRRPG